MQRFQFSLERVKDWRQKQLEIEEAALRRLFAERRGYEAEQARLDGRRRQAEREVLAMQAIEAQQLAALESYRVHLANEKLRLARHLEDCARRIAEQRLRTMEAQRRFRLLERLKERRLEEWRKQLDLEQEALASEIFLSQWGQ